MEIYIGFCMVSAGVYGEFDDDGEVQPFGTAARGEIGICMLNGVSCAVLSKSRYARLTVMMGWLPTRGG